MERTKRKNGLISGLLAIAFLFIAGFGFIMMPQKAQVAYAAVAVTPNAQDTYKYGTQGVMHVASKKTDGSDTQKGINYSWSGGTDNNGFCIEYDYNKIFEPNNLKKLSLLLSTHKVIYSNKKKVIDTKYITSLMDKKISEYEKLDLTLDSFEQLLTKKICWKQEKEWRLILVQDENILPVDIVGKIIIDETMLNTKNGEKLLRLAKVKKWKIIIRKMNNYGNDHIYKCL